MTDEEPRRVLGAPSPTFAESMRGVTDEHLALMEADGASTSAALLRGYRDAARKADR